MVWNINGNLALKIREPDFLRSISECDVAFLLETWLHPTQEDSLPIPKGFLLVARSRPVDNLLSHQWGGVVALFRDNIPVTVVHGVSAPDLLVLDLTSCFLVASYLPPKASNWHTWSDIDPEQRLQEALAYCSASGGKMVLVAGDLNARTGSDSSLFPRSRRVSLDTVLDSRGRRLLQWCSLYGLSILNGTSAERDCPGAVTCFQERGASVVDYVLASAAHVSCIDDGGLVMTRSQWSDHCQVVIAVTLPSEVFGLPPPGETDIVQCPAPPSLHVAATRLDKLANLAVLGAGLHSPASLYGSAYGPIDSGSAPRTVYLSAASGSVRELGDRVAFGCYWGLNHRGNEVMQVPGDQNVSRACLAAIVHVLQTTDPSQSLLIYSTSQYAVRVFVFSAPAYSSRGWACKNADLLKLGVFFLQQRSAVVEFRWFSHLSPNGHALAGHRLVRTGVRDPQLQSWVLPFCPSPRFRGPAASWASGVPKVSCNLLREDVQSHAPHQVTEGDLSLSTALDAHRGRLRDRNLQAQNLMKLLNAGSPREFWDLIRDWTDPKRRSPRVSVGQLYNEFQLRLNPPLHVPSTIDSVVCELREVLAGSIPSITCDRTPQGFFSRPFTLAEVEDAKFHLAQRHTKASPGLDGVPYRTVLDIPNDALLQLFNACVDSQDAPQSWLTTVLVGVLKAGKPDSSPESYRLVGLECCLLKVMTLLIDRRLRAWAEENNVLPDSQNGFREGYRTHNNSFILRTAIEKQGRRARYYTSLSLT